MAKKSQDEITFDDLVDDGIKAIIRSFGKGEDLRGAVWHIVNFSTRWADKNARKDTK